MKKEVENFKDYIVSNYFTKDQINLLFVTKLKTEDFADLRPSELMDLMEFMDIQKINKPVSNDNTRFKILGVLKRKHECGIRVNVRGHEQFFVDESGLMFEVVENDDEMTLTAKEIQNYGELTDPSHLSKAIIRGTIYDIEAFQRKINYGL